MAIPAGRTDAVLHWDNGRTWITIERADPRIEISDVMLTHAKYARCIPGVTLDQPDPGTFTGAILTITAENRRVIYRIGEQDPSGFWWHAEWPD